MPLFNASGVATASKLAGVPAVEIRRAEVDDADAIAALLHTAFVAYRNDYTPAAYDATVLDADRVRARLADARTWVAMVGDEIVGTVTAHGRGPDAVHMRSLAVLPSARGRRVGERLVGSLVDWAAATNAPRVTLSTTPFLEASRRLYARCGFESDDDRAGADLHGTPLIALVRQLPEAADR